MITEERKTVKFKKAEESNETANQAVECKTAEGVREEEIYYELGRAIDALEEAAARLNQYRNRLVSLPSKEAYNDNVMNQKEEIPIREKKKDGNPNLSEKTKKVLFYIQAFILAHGYSPSVREICAGVGVRSTSTVQNHINRLESKGYIIKKELSPRNMRINEEMLDQL